MDQDSKNQADAAMLEHPAGTDDPSRATESSREPEPEYEPQLPETD